MSDIKQFYTRKISNEGVKMPLVLPDGTETKEWLLIRGVDSDDFRIAEASSKRAAMELSSIKDDKERYKAIEAVKIKFIAAIVAGWSFKREFTLDAVIELLTEAPQIAESIDRMAANRSLFFAKESKD
jgi:hypothetical protein